MQRIPLPLVQAGKHRKRPGGRISLIQPAATATAEAAKKSETAGKAGTEGSPENSVDRETTAPKERGETTAARIGADRFGKVRESGQGNGCGNGCGIGWRATEPRQPHRPDRDRKAEYSAESGDSPPRDGAGVGQRNAGAQYAPIRR